MSIKLSELAPMSTTTTKLDCGMTVKSHIPISERFAMYGHFLSIIQTPFQMHPIFLEACRLCIAKYYTDVKMDIDTEAQRHKAYNHIEPYFDAITAAIDDKEYYEIMNCFEDLRFRLFESKRSAGAAVENIITALSKVMEDKEQVKE